MHDGYWPYFWKIELFKGVSYTSGKIWSARLIFLFFGSVFEYIHSNKYQNFNKFKPTDSEL
jgi:lipid II:glycine glycyltransferase (peptidoglycan interpeptide bridge formation enzyme)